MKRLNCFELQGIDRAVKSIVDNESIKVSVNDRINVYKVPSHNHSKYTIRVDIKVEVTTDDDRT